MFKQIGIMLNQSKAMVCCRCHASIHSDCRRP